MKNAVALFHNKRLTKFFLTFQSSLLREQRVRYIYIFMAVNFPIMKKTNTIFIIVVALLVFVAILLWREFDLTKKNSVLYVNHLEQLTGVGRLGSTHIHADFKVYINGEEIKVYQEKNLEKNKFTHMHPGQDEEDVIHVHATGITLKQFFGTLNIHLSRNCIKLEEKEFCTDNSKSLRYYVNGKVNVDAPNYVIEDLDKILITIGINNQTEIQKQLASIGNNACIQSKKC